MLKVKVSLSAVYNQVARSDANQLSYKNDKKKKKKAKDIKKKKKRQLWHYRTLLEFDPSSLSIQGLFTRAEIMEGQKNGKKTPLDTAEVLAKSIYRYVFF